MIRIRPFLGSLGLCLTFLHCATSSVFTKQAATGGAFSSRIVELPPSNITRNLINWEYDLAIMFYAPWCKNCQRMDPYWDSIASLSAGNKDLIVSQFNCEKNTENRDVCRALGVEVYPSILFIGYGDFHQAPPASQHPAATASQSLVRYNADLFPEAVYDWVSMLAWLSRVHRRWNDLKALVSGKSSASLRLEHMGRRLQAAEKKVELFGRELEKYKANELFDSLEDKGDVFPVLSALRPDSQNLPLRVCVADMAGEYCKYYDEPYCQALPQCAEEQLEPQACRPARCPFQDPRGCVVTSTCMRKDVIEEYKLAVSV